MFNESTSAVNGEGGGSNASSQSNNLIAAWAANLERRFLATFQSHSTQQHDLQPSHLQPGANRMRQESATTNSINSLVGSSLLDKLKSEAAWKTTVPPFILPSLQTASSLYSHQKLHGRWCTMHVKIAWQIKKYQDAMDASAAKNIFVPLKPSSKPHLLPPICFPPIGATFPLQNVTPASLKLTKWSRNFAAGASTPISQSMTSSSSYEKACLRSKSRSPLSKNHKRLSKERRPHLARVHRTNDGTRQSVQLEQSFLAPPRSVVAESKSTSLIH